MSDNHVPLDSASCPCLCSSSSSSSSLPGTRTCPGRLRWLKAAAAAGLYPGLTRLPAGERKGASRRTGSLHAALDRWIHSFAWPLRATGGLQKCSAEQRPHSERPGLWRAPLVLVPKPKTWLCMQACMAPLHFYPLQARCCLRRPGTRRWPHWHPATGTARTHPAGWVAGMGVAFGAPSSPKHASAS